MSRREHVPEFLTKDRGSSPNDNHQSRYNVGCGPPRCEQWGANVGNLSPIEGYREHPKTRGNTELEIVSLDAQALDRTRKDLTKFETTTFLGANQVITLK